MGRHNLHAVYGGAVYATGVQIGGAVAHQINVDTLPGQRRQYQNGCQRHDPAYHLRSFCHFPFPFVYDEWIIARRVVSRNRKSKITGAPFSTS